MCFYLCDAFTLYVRNEKYHLPFLKGTELLIKVIYSNELLYSVKILLN